MTMGKMIDAIEAQLKAVEKEIEALKIATRVTIEENRKTIEALQRHVRDLKETTA